MVLVSSIVKCKCQLWVILESALGQLDVSLGSDWGQLEVSLASACGQLGVNLRSAWHQLVNFYMYSLMQEP